MKITIPALATLSLLSSVSALENILIGSSDYGCNSFTLKGGVNYLWFSDAPKCTTGEYGPQFYKGGNLCDGRSYTLLGHQGLTFKGCSGRNGAYPTEVYDGGNKALNCYPVQGADKATFECARGCQPDPNVGRMVFPKVRCV